MNKLIQLIKNMPFKYNYINNNLNLFIKSGYPLYDIYGITKLNIKLNNSSNIDIHLYGKRLNSVDISNISIINNSKVYVLLDEYKYLGNIIQINKDYTLDILFDNYELITNHPILYDNMLCFNNYKEIVNYLEELLNYNKVCTFHITYENKKNKNTILINLCRVNPSLSDLYRQLYDDIKYIIGKNWINWKKSKKLYFKDKEVKYSSDLKNINHNDTLIFC